MVRKSQRPRSGGGTSPADANAEMVTALFADVMEGSVNTRVDPRACVPLTKIRGIVGSGFVRLKALFSGRMAQTGRVSANPHGDENGFVAGSDSAIVIRLTGALKRHVVDYFKTQSGADGNLLTETQARQKADFRSEWFGVVDGMHRLVAILELVKNYYDSWKFFMWPVTVLKGGHDIQVLRQLARHQNLKHNASFFVETTFYDMILGLKQEGHRMTSLHNGKKPSAKQIASAFDGCPHKKDNTVKQTATTALRLSLRVIHTIGEIMNSEHAELAISAANGGGDQAGLNHIMSTVGCRVYRKFIHITSLKSATAFMNAEGPDAEENQINTLYRLRDSSRVNKFKPAAYKIPVEQFAKASAAMKEARKFELLLEEDTWPQDMETLRKNLLQTTKFDVEVIMNKGNDHDILQSIMSMYHQVCPQVAPLKERKYKETYHAVQSNALVATVLHCDHAAGQTGGPDFANEAEGCNEKTVDGTKAKGDITVQQEERTETEAEEGNAVDEKGRLVGDEIGGVGDLNGKICEEEERNEKALADAEASKATKVAKEGVACGKEGNEAISEIQAASILSERLDTVGAKCHTEHSAPPAPPDYLKEMRIECHQMKWQTFDKTARDDDSALFDLILTDPPYGTPKSCSCAGTAYDNYIDDAEITALVQFARRTLRAGGWFFAFLAFRTFGKFYDATEGWVYRPQYPFVIMKNTEMMEEHRGTEFPQCGCEFAVFARAPRDRTDGFKSDLRSPYHFLPSKQKRKFACLSDVPVTKDKLLNPGTKVPSSDRREEFLLVNRTDVYVLPRRRFCSGHV